MGRLGVKEKQFNLNIVDAIVILFNIAAARGNFLPYWLFNMTKVTWVEAIIIIIDLIYIFSRLGVNFRGYLNKYNIPVYIAVILLAYNTLNIFLHGGNYVPYFEYSFVIFLFSIILNSICNFLTAKPISLITEVKQISKGYVWISLLSIFGAFFSFLLLRMGFKSYNPIDADFLEANIENGATYYLSFFSINSYDSMLRVPFFQDFGILTGLFHEPHVFSYNAFPCIFLLFGFFQKNKIVQFVLVLMALLVVMFSGSTTNILALSLTLLVLFAIKIRKHFFKASFTLLLLLAVIYFYIGNDSTLYEFVLGRLAVDNYSQQYSVSLLEFAFTPKSLFGSDFLATDYVDGLSTGQDVGFIPFILNICFILAYIKNVVLLLKKGDWLCLYVSLSSLYFIFHSMKMGMTMYIQTPFVFLVFLQSFMLNNYGRVSAFKNNMQNRG